MEETNETGSVDLSSHEQSFKDSENISCQLPPNAFCTNKQNIRRVFSF